MAMLGMLVDLLQVARDLGTLWATLQPPSDCSPSDRQALLLEVATASAAAHAAWQSEQAAKTQVSVLSVPPNCTCQFWLALTAPTGVLQMSDNASATTC